jgi:uncharacterized membrane protein HdeD (DUF308 family)
LLAILFGFLALGRPRAAAIGLVALFAMWAFLDAALAFAASVQRGRAGERWGWFLFEGIVSLAAGIIAISSPGITLFVLTIVVAVRAIVEGALMIGGAISSKGASGRWLHGVTGVVSILFGLLLLWQPLVGGLALVWTIGVYAIVLGFMMIALSIHVHGLQRGLPGPAATAH